MSSAKHRAIVWADADQVELIREAARVGEFEIVAVGALEPGIAATLGQDLQTAVADDLRQAVQGNDIDLLWLACPQAIAADERRMIREIRFPTISSEPRPGAINEILSAPGEASITRFVPLFRESPGYFAASQVFDQFGEVKAINIALRSSRGEGTLFARLFDAMDCVSGICGHPTRIDASLAAPLSAVPEALRNLQGHMTLNFRLGDSRCASASVSDCSGRWFRGLTLQSENGCLRISDQAFEWIDSSGSLVDSHAEPNLPRPGELIGRRISRLFANREPQGPPTDALTLLSLCEAARLSCRTGQPETPGKILKMLGTP